MAQLLLFSEYRRQGRRVYFDRSELNQLLAVYARKVANAVWRDYAIDNRSNMAVFSVYRRSQEQPIFAITKVLLKGEREPSYVLISRNRQLQSSPRLSDIVESLDRQLAIVA